ncbi:J domain-containing protein [Halolamina sediminis]|jgi:hypothetical protein|uniref:J domain-containing protein n=1 Tax=Halolamina sediminis TaxID=1480675 RepID=UPI0006B561A8|nr:J domain-containing protein [Halolamina sediminis]
MVRDTVGVVLAAVLTGLASVLLIAAIAVQPFLVVAALPFAAGAYLLWEGSLGEYGRLGPSGTCRARAANGRTTSEGARPESDGTGHADAAGRRRRDRTRDSERARRKGRRRASGRERSRGADSLARREAAAVLGVDADAEPAVVRSAYRDRVKEVHPDTEDGDAETFQEVNDAYERLRED